MPLSNPSPSLILQLTEGPPLTGQNTRWKADPDAVLAIGRGQDARIQLPDASVSRRHAEITHDGLGWHLKDLGSRHGTGLNGRAVASGSSTTLAHRDMLQVGPWFFRVLIAGEISTGVTISEVPGGGERVRRVLPTEIGSLAQQRLDLVLRAAEDLGAAIDETGIAQTVVTAVLDGARSARAALVRLVGDDLKVLALGGADGEAFELSRSLITEAMAGQVVLLESSGQQNAAYGHSIIELGIHSAFCAPVRVGDRVEAVLYLDARGREAAAVQDAAAFVNAMARICGLAMANISRIALERQQAQLETDLAAARVAQRMMMPPSTGRTAGVEFAVTSKPGRYVAGDLIGIEERPDGRVCFFLGDVTGKGAGAAMLMGIAQSYLTAALTGGAHIDEAVNGLHAMITPRIESGQFISLWIGEIDPATGSLHSIDAGHGYAVLRTPDGQLESSFGEGGMPVGIDLGAQYTSGKTPYTPGSTLLLFTDGLIEQPAPTGERFGMDRALEAARACPDPAGLLARLERELVEFGGTDRYDDDLTMAAFRFS